jgi:GTP cyclohydrolase IA
VDWESLTNRDRIENIVRDLLVELGEDPQREGLRDTPRRVADLYEEIFKGYSADSELDVSFAEKSGFVVQRDIPFYSICEHHLLPFFGRVHIAYEPNGRVIGISKLARLVDKYAKRLQLQERMTNQIVDELQGAGVMGAVVVVEAEHLCLRMRGPKSNGLTITSAFRGSLTEENKRAAAINLIGTNEISKDTENRSESIE